MKININININKLVSAYWLLLFASASQGLSVKKYLEIAEKTRKQMGHDIEYYSEFRQYFTALPEKERSNLMQLVCSNRVADLPDIVTKYLPEFLELVEKEWPQDLNRLREFKKALDGGIKKYSKEIEGSFRDLEIAFGDFEPQIPEFINVELLSFNSCPISHGSDFGRAVDRKTIVLSVFSLESDIVIRRVIMLIIHEITHCVFETKSYKQFLKENSPKDFNKVKIDYAREALIELFVPRGIFASKYFDIHNSLERSKEKSSSSLKSKITYKSQLAYIPEMEKYLLAKKPIDSEMIKKISQCVAMYSDKKGEIG